MVSFGKSRGRSHGFSLLRARQNSRLDFDATVPPPAEAVSGFSDSDSTTWRSSSLDLQQGLQVSEEPMDTLPGDLLDAFFRR